MLILIIFLYIAIIYLSIIRDNKIVNNSIYRYLIYLGFTFSFVYIFGWRPPDAFNDTEVYLYIFQQMHSISFKEALLVSPFEIGFTLLQWLIAKFTINGYFYLSIVFIIFFCSIIKSFKVFYSYNYIIAILMFISTPLFVTMSGNIIRSGLAFSILLLGISFLLKGNKKRAYIIMLISCSIHTTVLPFVLLMICYNLNKYKIKWYLYAYIGSIILFITKIHLSVFPFLMNFGKLEIYSQASTLAAYGNNTTRYDFLLFNTILILLVLFANKYMYKFKDEVMNLFNRLIIIAGVVFNTLGFIAYSDRLAIYVWLFFMISIILAILEFCKNRSILLPFILLVFIGFSLFSKSYIFYH